MCNRRQRLRSTVTATRCPSTGGWSRYPVSCLSTAKGGFSERTIPRRRSGRCSRTSPPSSPRPAQRCGTSSKLTIYLTDLADLSVFRQVRDEYISLEHPPASSLVQVSGLINPAFRIEVDALAAI
jgi:hypothetical protein